MREYRLNNEGLEIQELLNQIKNKTIYGNATKDTAGLMSAEDKSTLDNLVDNVGENIQQLNSLNQAVSENTTAIEANAGNIATNTANIATLNATTGNLGTRLDAAEETLENIFQLDANNFMGIYASDQVLPTPMTEAGWALVGDDLTALHAYVWNIPQGSWQQYGNTTYDYSDYSGLATQVATIGSKIDELEKELTEIEYIEKDIPTTLVSGYVRFPDGRLMESSASSYRVATIDVQKGHTVVVALNGVATAAMISEYIDGIYFPIYSGSGSLQTYKFTALEDTQIALSATRASMPSKYIDINYDINSYNKALSRLEINNPAFTNSFYYNSIIRELWLDESFDDVKSAPSIKIDFVRKNYYSSMDNALSILVDDKRFYSRNAEMNEEPIAIYDGSVIKGYCIINWANVYNLNGGTTELPRGVYDIDKSVALDINNSLRIKTFLHKEEFIETFEGLYDKTHTLAIVAGERISASSHITGLNIRENTDFIVNVKTSNGGVIKGYGIFINNYKLVYGSNTSQNYDGEDVILRCDEVVKNLGITISGENITSSGNLTISLKTNYAKSVDGRLSNATERIDLIESELHIGGNNIKVPAPKYHSSQVLQQNYYDDNHEPSGISPMLRTDVIVWNQGNLGVHNLSRMASFPYEKRQSSFGDETCCVKFIDVYWREVQTLDSIYDFSAVQNEIQAAVDSRARVYLRIFPAVLGSTYGEYVHDSVTYRIGFPDYIAELMENNSGQFAEYDYNGNKWLELDINLDAVYTEYDKLLTAFGNWFSQTTVNNISLNDLVLVTELGFIGAYGEGRWSNLEPTTTSDKLVRYVQSALTALPNTQICIGNSLYIKEDYRVSSEYFIKAKELSNSAGYVGLFVDCVGAYINNLLSGQEVIDGYTSLDLIEKYAKRGDFFTGEFAMWINRSYFGTHNGLWAYELLYRFKCAYLRVNNFNFYDTQNGYSTNIDDITAYYLANSISMVGFRLVLNKLWSNKSGNTLELSYELTNIGLHKCPFDIYRMYYIITDLDSGTETEQAISFDLRTINPLHDEPLQYTSGSGRLFYITLNVPTRCKVSVVFKDKNGLQNPMYLSNYGRAEDGSYELYSDL